ncbi:MAG: polysaccharide deacetylase family protein [Thermacetogeniaceae bacterium]
MFVFYARKRSMAALLTAVMTLIAIIAISISFSAHQSQQVFQPETPIMRGNTANKCVSITVNIDWGEEYLPEMLAILQEHHVAATFFITGRWAKNNGPLVQKIAQQGNEIGNHGFSHPHVNNLSLDENMAEIQETENILYQLTGRHTKFFAPPYGEYNDTVLDAANKSSLQTVLWSIDTVDWQNPTPGWIISRLSNMTHSGAIILMHPTPVTVKVLPDMIKTLSGQGYEIVSLEKLLSE